MVPVRAELGWPNAFILAIGQGMACGDDEFNLLQGDGGPCTAFPNVFSPKFEAYCRYVAARTCAPRKDDQRDSFHADAAFTLPEKKTLAPGATFEFESRPFVAGAAGAGGRAVWDRLFPSLLGLNP